MEGNCFNQTVFLFTLLLAIAASSVRGHSTRVGFYSSTCPRAESIVKSTVKSHFKLDPTIAPGLLRMHFHDCFVRGCDASILIDGPNAEKTAPASQFLKGYKVIDDAKFQLECECPGVVSCADILALAARDSVVLTKGTSWAVPTGRRDGTVSKASDTDGNMPGFQDTVDVLKQKFAAKGLNTRDLVTLVGAHTIGTTACEVFSYRLYNFTSTGADPSINPAFVSHLQALCPQNRDGSRQIALDTGSADRFDTSFFAKLREGKGILESDQRLWTDVLTKTFVQRFLEVRGSLGLSFNVEFGKSMVKMSNIEVKTGTMGEIRKVCSKVNEY
ncbi:peroxidase N1-like [Gossypium arboreum]|uniref:peroxidase N1-like n=1 Tax=Gossypium arboreum TaxID=29729 RepID=UPI00081974B0|nr:peroxidase N1-like [Gossypium arboreum]